MAESWASSAVPAKHTGGVVSDAFGALDERFFHHTHAPDRPTRAELPDDQDDVD
jgi:hypothetical protein